MQTLRERLQTLREGGVPRVLGGEAGARLVVELGEHATGLVELLGQLYGARSRRGWRRFDRGSVGGGGVVIAHAEQCSAGEGSVRIRNANGL